MQDGDSGSTPRTWRPIEDLPPAWVHFRTSGWDALEEVWEGQQEALEGSGALSQFIQRLVREWSIETGLIERLYTLSDSATRTLVEQGFDAAYLSHDDTDLPPGALVRILNDHREAAEGLFAFVKQARPLSTSYIKELHAVLCRHQETSDAIDSLGRPVKVRLERGKYKTQPNNPSDRDSGEILFQYCPPEHVDAEMERLVQMHLMHARGVENDGTDADGPWIQTDEEASQVRGSLLGPWRLPYVVEAAWLHHRFAQIHPFQDGNGRVARALAMLVCLRGGGFPFVVKNRDKVSYIAALRAADAGDLEPLVRLVAAQQESAFKKAIGLSQQALDEVKGIEAIAADARRRIERSATQEKAGVGERAERLASITHEVLTDVARRLEASMQGVAGFDALASRSDAATANQFTSQILATAGQLDYVANVTAERWWARLEIRRAAVTSLVVSFHHLGQGDQGVMVASAFFDQRELSPARGDEVERPSFHLRPISDDTFLFTGATNDAALDARFRSWLNRAIDVGLDAWRRSP